jgi:predicted Zn-dependent protease
MKFEPRVPRDDVNVTARHPLKEGLVMLGGALAIVVALAGLAALLVDRIVPYVPPAWEAGMFPDFALLREEPDTDEERKTQSGLESLLERLLVHWPEGPFDLRVGVLDDETPNALAFPGGLILVTEGLLESVESENELAFVVGHELGHYRNRDHLRSLGRGLALGLVLTAFGQGGSVGDLLSLSGEISGRSFSREQEEEADAFGLRLVAAEYGHVAGATDFFEKLPSPASALGRSLDSYLSTHPLSDERVETMKALALESGFSLDGETTLLRW